MMTTPFIEGRCYFTPESIVEISADWGDDEVLLGFDTRGSIGPNSNVHWAFAWVPRYVVAALIFGEEN